MMEVGPWRMDGKDSLKQLTGGWEEYANVLYSEPRSLPINFLPRVTDIYTLIVSSVLQSTNPQEQASPTQAATTTSTSSTPLQNTSSSS